MYLLNQVEFPKTVSSAAKQNQFDFQQAIEYHRLRLMDAAPLLLMRDLFTGSGATVKFSIFLLMRCKIIH